MNTYKQTATKDLFKGGKVIFAGFSKRNEAYSMSIYDALSRSGLEVYPYNQRKGETFSVKVFDSLDAIPGNPDAAVVAVKAEHALGLVDSLHGKGVKNILFVSRTAASPAVLEKCGSLGVTAAVACPLMLYGKGMHRFHGWLAGIKA